MSRAADCLPADPRQRLTTLGAQTLGDEELLSLILHGPASTERVRSMLEAIGGLGSLASACPSELRQAGLGPASAAALVAAVELSRRLAVHRLPWGRPLHRPTDVADFLHATYRGACQEQFMVLGLDARQRVRLVRTVATGSLSQVDVHPRELFRPLVRAGTHSVILVHNHPSGEPRPSDADLQLTRRMAEVGELLGIPVLDHLVIAGTECVSMAALGLVGKL